MTVYGQHILISAMKYLDGAPDGTEGKGVRVTRRWHRFENFLADMGERLGRNLTRPVS